MGIRCIAVSSLRNRIGARRTQGNRYLPGDSGPQREIKIQIGGVQPLLRQRPARVCNGDANAPVTL